MNLVLMMASHYSGHFLFTVFDRHAETPPHRWIHTPSPDIPSRLRLCPHHDIHGHLGSARYDGDE
jgi:hypothetical protein